jgi:hypothetical protein
MGLLLGNDDTMRPDNERDAVGLYGLWCRDCGAYIVTPDDGEVDE